MRIAIDARWIFPEISGIGEYTRELIRHLARTDRTHTYTLFFDNDTVLHRTMDETRFGEAPNFRTCLLPFGVFSIANQLHMPGILRREGVTLFHSTNYMIPLLAFPRYRRHRVKCVTTIHDAIPLLFPRHAPKSRKARMFPLYRRLMIEVGARADAIVTDSRASRTDLLRLLRIPPKRHARVHAIYCGVAERFSPAGAASNASGPVSDAVRTLLYVGRLDPYKNVLTLLEAVARARASVGFPLRLAIAGSPDPRYPETPEAVRRLGIQDAVQWLGYLDDQALVDQYRQADLLVHPSRYEGFGLQVAEAMRCGLPVVCTTGGSLPEIAGDAALSVDPDDVGGMSKAIVKVLSDPELAQTMSRNGLEQAAQFTWEQTTAQMLAVYEQVASGK